MIISAKVIRRTPTNRKCSACESFIGTQPLLQLYGAAERGDQPYSMWLHLACAPEEWAGITTDQKITAALEDRRHTEKRAVQTELHRPQPAATQPGKPT